jgi:nicotinamidase-related amidase
MIQKVKAIGADAVHVCVDLQRLFAEETEWHTPAIARILPNVIRLTAHRPARSIFTRFCPPAVPTEAEGAWRGYYERWAGVTTSVLGAEIIDLVEPLAAFVPPAQVADKTTYSAFESADFRAKLAALDCRTVICSGVETDVCVLGTVMQAMDRGYRVILVSDAVESSNAEAQRASLDHVYRRFEDQIEIGTTEEVIALWPEAAP